MDPWFDMFVLEKKNLKLDAAFKEIQKNTKKVYAHSANIDVTKLKKLVSVRALFHQSLVIRIKDYKQLIREGKEARYIFFG